MKLNTSYVIAAIAALAIVIWFLVNSGSSGSPDTPAQATAPAEASLPSVIVQTITAQPHENSFKLFGRTAASREVTVKAETAGRVISTPARKGRVVKASTLLCEQDKDARGAILAQAEANLKAREADYKAANILVERGFQSAIQLESQKANVDAARAAVMQAEIESNSVNMRAPFAGVLDAQLAEVGDYLSPGLPCATIVQLDPLLVTINLTETQLGKVGLGQEAEIDLVTGQTVSGKVSFIEAKAQPQTRTFTTEISVPNSDYSLKSGITATVKIKAGTTPAHLIPSKILSLDETGKIGVRYVGGDDRVVFAPVQTIDESENGIWVTGLPERTRIITEGQEFVTAGLKVDPNPAQYDSGSP